MSACEHTFQVPIMGIGFSIDTPMKVAQYGISSVISLVNDSLIEKMREYYSKKAGEVYCPITKDMEDHRAVRITEYLNLMQRVVTKQVDDIRNAISTNANEVRKYFAMLPDGSTLKKNFMLFLSETSDKMKKELIDLIRSGIVAGEICVNIMTKVDRDNYKDGMKLEKEFSDALSALRGFALSDGPASIVFSAGFNRRLFSYLENFDCFYPDESGKMEKKIILKISDYRSALTQAKFLAAKGIWISEFRVESGLNCSGHVFPSDGKTAGLILDEIKNKREELMDTLFPVYKEAVKKKKGIELSSHPEVIYTYQGGVATAKEHEFLMKYYDLDRVGWGAAFMFVPEVINLSPETLDKMIRARYEDLYISLASPMGVPFNTLRENINEEKMYDRYLNGEYGCTCSLGYLCNNTEFTEKPICTASRQYMTLKIEALKKEGLTGKELEKAIKKVLIKYCLCADLSKSPVTPYKVEKDDNGRDVFSVCSGKTAAYFNREITLEEMADHIYGRRNLIDPKLRRPSLFVTDLRINVEYLGTMIEDHVKAQDIEETKANIEKGIEYCLERAEELEPLLDYSVTEFRAQLTELKNQLCTLHASV